MSDVDLKEHIDKRFDNVDRDMKQVQDGMKGLFSFKSQAELQMKVNEMKGKETSKDLHDLKEVHSKNFVELRHEVKQLEVKRQEHEKSHGASDKKVRWLVAITGGLGLIVGGIMTAIAFAIKAAAVLGI